MPLRAVVTAAVLLLVGAALAVAAPGDRDPTYGVDFSGIGRQDLGSGTQYADLAALPGGGSVAVGEAAGAGEDPPIPQLVVARHDENGLLVPGFGGGSPNPGVFKSRLFATGPVRGRLVAADAEGRILVAAIAPTSLPGPQLLRLRADGTPDPAFSADGVAAIEDLGASSFDVVGLAVSPASGRIVMAVNTVSGTPSTGRITLLAYTPSGQLDTSFAGDGKLVIGGSGPGAPTVAASDLEIDVQGRTVLSRVLDGSWTIQRLTPAGATDATWAGDGTLEFSAPDADDLRLALDGSAPSSPGRPPSCRSRATPTCGSRLTASGAVEPGFGRLGLANAPVPRARHDVRDVTVTTEGRYVVLGSAQDRTQELSTRLLLTRVNPDGIPDASFAPGQDPPHAAVDDLAQPVVANVFAGGIVPAPGGRVRIAGLLAPTGDQDGWTGFVARYGADATAPTAKLTVSYSAFGDPSFDPVVYGRPDRPVQLTASGSIAGQGSINRIEFDADGDGSFETGGTQDGYQRVYPPGRTRVSVRVRNAAGLTDVAFVDVDIRSNVPPTAELTSRRLSGTGLPTSLLTEVAVGDPIVFIARTTEDAKRRKVELDLDGQPGYEYTGSGRIVTYDSAKTVSVGVRVTDNEGAVAESRRTVVAKVLCDEQTVISLGRLRAKANCWKKTKKKIAGESTEIWTASQPDPPAANLNGLDGAISQLEAVDAVNLQAQLVFPVVNGIQFRGADKLELRRREDNDQVTIKAVNATAQVPRPGSGTTFVIRDRETFTWELTSDGKTLKASASKASYGELPVRVNAFDIPLPAAGQAKLRFYPSLPDEFGGTSASSPVEFTVGGGATARAAATRECFRTDTAILPGVDLGNVEVCHNGAGSWDVKATVGLRDFAGDGFSFLPNVKADIAIREGDFASLAAEAAFNPGVPLYPPAVSLRSIRFSIALRASDRPSSCVPEVGTEDVSLFEFRRLLRSYGFDPAYVNELVPDYRIDHGVPDFALCGGVTVDVGFRKITLAEGAVDLGIAHYPDGRPTAFRAVGSLKLLGFIQAQATLAVYSSNYVDLSATLDAEFAGNLASVKGGFRFEATNQKFNASAYVEGCVLFDAYCEGVQGLLSSKGVGVCVILRFFGADWRPGVTYEWNEGPTLYATGCDLGDVRVNVSGEGSTTITPIPAGTANSRSTVFDPGAALARPRAALTEIPELPIEVPPGLPGQVFAAKGQGGVLAKFTLIGPKGERISVDGSVDDGRFVKSAGYLIAHDKRHGISHVMLAKPSAGRWRLVADTGSVPIVDVRTTAGLPQPDVSAKVLGTGRDRTLSYRVARRPGQVVEFVERGATGRAALGRVGSSSEGGMRFSPAVGKAERRSVVAVVTQDGMLRGEYPVAAYRAPATAKPSRPGRVLVRRAGSRVTVRFLPAAGAASHLVRVRLSDGRVIQEVLKSSRSLVIGNVAKGTRVSVRVSGRGATGLVGRAGTRTLAAVAVKQPAARAKAKAKRR